MIDYLDTSVLVAALTNEIRTEEIQTWLAARYADQHASGLRSGDALHLAIAANNGARIQPLDQGLVESAQALGVSATLR